MSQGSKYDSAIIKMLKNKELILDKNNGSVFSITKNGNKKELGGIDRSGNCVFYPSFKSTERQVFKYWVCRAVYLAFNDYFIPKNHEVFHIDGDRQNNNIENLDIRPFKRVFNPKAWTPEEEKILLENYKEKSYSELQILLPNRSIKSLRHKLKNIDIKKPYKKRRWISDDDKKLIELYSDNNLSVLEISKIMNRSRNSISLRVKRFNINRKPFKPKGFKSKNFYLSIKKSFSYGSSGSECCLCGYDKHIDFHHIDGNRNNNDISNIASLCPNCHREVENSEHQDKFLYTIWWRIYDDNEIIKNNNKREIKGGMEKQ